MKAVSDGPRLYNQPITRDCEAREGVNYLPLLIPALCYGEDCNKACSDLAVFAEERLLEVGSSAAKLSECITGIKDGD